MSKLDERSFTSMVIPNRHSNQVALLLLCYHEPGLLIAGLVQVHPRIAGRVGY